MLATLLLLSACDRAAIELDGDRSRTIPPEDTAAPEDTDLPEQPTPYGTGLDGALVVDDLVDLTRFASEGRASPDVVTLRVRAIDGATVSLVDDVSGLSRGDEVLILDLQGDGGGVGTYTFARLEAVTATLTLEAPPDVTFGDPAEHAVVVQRVPNYSDVTVLDGGTLTVAAWDGQRGGVLALRVAGALSVAEGGRVTVDGRGYLGGESGSCVNCDAFQGESWSGPGAGDHDGNEGYNGPTGEWAANDGGGGAHITGGGGEHAGGATPGDPFMPGATAPEAGEPYGDAALSELFFGSGGGGVWNDGTATSGSGGAGGGILLVSAARIEAGAAAFGAAGATTSAWATGTYTYGAGGGAGGTVWLQAEALTLGEGAIDARGGYGESSHQRAGGDGGVGRVRVDCDTVNGGACALGAFEGLSEPEPGAVRAAP